MIRRTLVLLLLGAPLAATPVPGQQPAPQASPPPADSAPVPAPAGAPVVVGGDTILVVPTRLGPYSAAERATAIRLRLEGLARDPFAREYEVRVVRGETSSDVMVQDRAVLTITEADAAALGLSRDVLDRRAADAVAQALREQGFRARLRIIAMGVLFAFMASLATVLVFRLVNRIFPRLYEMIERGRAGWIPALRVQRVELVSKDQLADALLWTARMVRAVLLVLLLYLAVPVILSFFPWTRPYADRLFDYILTPFASVWASFISYLPEFFALGAIVVVTWYLLKLIRPIFLGIARGSITLSGFYPDWAMPTYKIVRALIMVFALIAAWPYLPGSDSEAFKGVGVFVGLLISLGSASAISNMIGGVVLTYMRPFRVGDRVRISDTEGDVVEKSLLITRIRTTKNVDITIPNSMVLGSHIINYSSSAKAQGLILHTTVTIGYDVPWRQVHELLLGAARETPDLLADPAPFVLQTSLDDFYVAYQLNAFTSQPNRMQAIYSDLHASIQDRFNEAGIEIMSPHYRAARDGNPTTIPAAHLPADYRPPAFRVVTEPVEDTSRPLR